MTLPSRIFSLILTGDYFLHSCSRDPQEIRSFKVLPLQTRNWRPSNRSRRRRQILSNPFKTKWQRFAIFFNNHSLTQCKVPWTFFHLQKNTRRPQNSIKFVQNETPGRFFNGLEDSCTYLKRTHKGTPRFFQTFSKQNTRISVFFALFQN